ncbi:protein Allo37 [Cyprinid herpesvirus 1]|uniref:Protein Allo37 n=1 Tax=Cyprinid herpesvirus 1 TaxID=317858 RepID=K7PC87_9VIRU|nr:protein Allo37 [Cyprinid herpesvirus 1]AFJ20387.1 protein Allo37 [Cyprinid herpesvirus 1]
MKHSGGPRFTVPGLGDVGNPNSELDLQALQFQKATLDELLRQERDASISVVYHKRRTNVGKLKNEQMKESLLERLKADEEHTRMVAPVFLGPGHEFNKVLEVTKTDVVFASTMSKIISDVDLCDHINKTMMSNINFADTAVFSGVDWLTGPEQNQREDHRMAMVRTLLCKLVAQVELRFRCYLTEFFKRYFLYAIVYNCIPYQIISCDDMDRPHEDLKFVRPTQVDAFEKKLAELELRMVSASRDAKSPVSAVHDLVSSMKLPPTVQYPLELFFQELLARNVESRDFAGFFQNAGLCKLVCFAYRLCRGYITYIPPFEEQVAIMYDKCTKMCRGMDKCLNPYKMFMLSEDPSINRTNMYEALKMAERFNRGFKQLTNIVFGNQKCLVTAPREERAQERNDMVKSLINDPSVVSAANRQEIYGNNLLQQLKATSHADVSGDSENARGRLLNQELLRSAVYTSKANMLRRATTQLSNKASDGSALAGVLHIAHNGDIYERAECISRMRELTEGIRDSSMKAAAETTIDQFACGSESFSGIADFRHVHLGEATESLHAFDTSVTMGDVTELFNVWHGFWKLVLLNENFLSHKESIIAYKGKNAEEDTLKIGAASIKLVLARVISLLNKSGFCVQLCSARSMSIDDVHKYSLFLNPNSIASMLSDASGLPMCNFDPTLIRQFQFHSIGGVQVLPGEEGGPPKSKRSKPSVSGVPGGGAQVAPSVALSSVQGYSATSSVKPIL